MAVFFVRSKKPPCDKMSGVGQFIIGKCVMAKAIHVLHLSERARCYGTDKKTKGLVGLVVKNVNIPTATGRASWVFRIWFHLGDGQTKLHELSVRSVKKSPAPVIREEEQEITDSLPIDGWLRLDTIAVQVDKDNIQAPNNGGEAPTHIVPNPDNIIQLPIPPNNQEVEETQPVLSSEDELVPVLQTMHIVPDHTALLPVPPVPNPDPTDADPILCTNHEYNWYNYNNPDNLPLNGRVQAKKWVIRLPTGDRLDQSGYISKDYLPMDYFFFSFPTEKINLTIRLTNYCLPNGLSILLTQFI